MKEILFRKLKKKANFGECLPLTICLFYIAGKSQTVQLKKVTIN